MPPPKIQTRHREIFADGLDERIERNVDVAMADAHLDQGGRAHNQLRFEVEHLAIHVINMRRKVASFGERTDNAEAHFGSQEAERQRAADIGLLACHEIRIGNVDLEIEVVDRDAGRT